MGKSVVIPVILIALGLLLMYAALRDWSPAQPNPIQQQYQPGGPSGQ